MENEHQTPAAQIFPAGVGTLPEQQIPHVAEGEGLAIGEIVAVVMEYRWLVAMITASMLLLGLCWVFVSTPIFKADGLIQVEEKASGMSALKELQPLLGDNTTVSAELEILT